MKFNWGTGILLFLILFLSASSVFIVFAFRQGVSLVDKDYYEKGVDYTLQMEVESRSVKFQNSVETHQEGELFIVDFEKSLVSDIDSGSVLLFRPSNSSMDFKMPMNFSENRIEIPRINLTPGRYILKLYWNSEGLKYEVE